MWERLWEGECGKRVREGVWGGGSVGEEVRGWECRRGSVWEGV